MPRSPTPAARSLKALAAPFALLFLVGTSPAAAQYGFGVRPARTAVGGGLSFAQPVGEFKNYVNTGWGGGGHFMMRLDQLGFVALRADVGFLVYGHETKRVSMPGAGRIEFDVSTNNNILTYSIGPQLMVPTGAIRPYVNANVGGAYFFTESSIGGNDNAGDFASTLNFDDNVLSYGYGGGVFIPFSVRRADVGLDVGARFVGNNETRYLREGGIEDLPTGGYAVSPIESKTNFVHYHVGVKVGIRSRHRR
jgi:hypothetical protein